MGMFVCTWLTLNEQFFHTTWSSCLSCKGGRTCLSYLFQGGTFPEIPEGCQEKFTLRSCLCVFWEEIKGKGIVFLTHCGFRSSIRHFLFLVVWLSLRRHFWILPWDFLGGFFLIEQYFYDFIFLNSILILWMWVLRTLTLPRTDRSDF